MFVLGRLAVDTVNDEDYKFEFGKGVVMNKGEKVAIIANRHDGTRISRSSERIGFQPNRCKYPQSNQLMRI